MPEDIKPPKTIAEMGVHIVYMSKSINTMQKTLEKMVDGSVTKVDFDDHVVWGEGVAKDHEKRIKTLEDISLVERHSFAHRFYKKLDDRAMTIIITIIIAGFLYFIVKTSQIKPETITPFLG